MTYTVEQVAHWFVVDLVRPSGGVDNRISTACVAIDKLLKDGWKLEEVVSEMLSFAQTFPAMIAKVFHVDEIFVNKQPPDNLMQPDIFYYHNALRDVGEPVRIRRNADGEFVREEKPFYLTMKKRFRMKDLLDYWYDKMKIKSNDHMIKQDEGKFKYLLNVYYLDEILFAIDCAKRVRTSMQAPMLRNAFDLEKYMDEARDLIKEKTNIHIGFKINRTFEQDDAR